MVQQQKIKGPGRNRCPRRIGFMPQISAFKPVGIPMMELSSVTLSHEELESLRLVDLLSMDLESASKKVGISRRTFTNDLKSGRKKVVEALTGGKAIIISGGDFTFQKDPDPREGNDNEDSNSS